MGDLSGCAAVDGGQLAGLVGKGEVHETASGNRCALISTPAKFKLQNNQHIT